MSYYLVRTVHLLLGLGFVLFLLTYGMSAVQMAHPGWFDISPKVTEASFAVAPADGSSPATLADYLRAERGLRGSLRNVQQSEAGFTFQVVRPGTVHDVSFTRSGREVQLRTNVVGVMGMLNRIHHVGGVESDYPLLNVWGLFVALTSTALLLSGLTGVYMWFVSHRKRRTGGALLLGFSLTVSLLLVVLIRTA